MPHFPEQEAQCCSDFYLVVSGPNSIRTSVASHCGLEFHVTLVLFVNVPFNPMLLYDRPT